MSRSSLRPLLLAFALVASLSVKPSSQAGSQALPLQFPLEPAGEIVGGRDPRLAEGSLPVAFVRSPDTDGPGGRGRYLVAVNSGFGVQFAGGDNTGQQLLQVIDLAAQPAPTVVQAVYFPSPQSVNVGVAFAPRPGPNGAWTMFASGGVQDRIWRFTFTPGADQPIAPAHGLHDGPLRAPFIDLSASAPPPLKKAVDRETPGLLYPTGIAVSPKGGRLYVANNLADSLAIVPIGGSPRRATVIALRDDRRPRHAVYPYDVVALERHGRDKLYVSLWNDGTVAVVDPASRRISRRIPAGSHPSALLLSRDGSRLFVASANSDTVSIIDTVSDREVAQIPVGLRHEPDRLGNSPQALALAEDERRLFVADAQSQAVAVVRLGEEPAGGGRESDSDEDRDEHGPRAERAPGQAVEAEERTRVVGYIPTARYPSALAVVGDALYVANGKGEPGPRPNAPTADFPANNKLRGAYSVSLVRSSIRRVALPDGDQLAAMTTAVMRSNGLVGKPVASLFDGPSPITHVIYIIKENRTYDQVFGDVPASGDGTRADGDPALALFGAGQAARRPDGPPQDITPNHHALALRFGLFDRFFVNAEASADGHNWSTAAFSSDYVDKTFRANYSQRGRTYDYEGFNRLPDLDPPSELPRPLRLPLTANDVVEFIRGYVPYLNASRDVSEADSLYLWDAAARAGLAYRNYGEFVGTISADDVAAMNARRKKTYPDTSPTVGAVPTKRALEEHHSSLFRGFDLWTPDAMTTESYRAARARGVDALVRGTQADSRFRGVSRLGTWLDEFDRYVADLQAGQGDHLPALTIMRLPNDHTIGLVEGHATPQFLVADNDFAVGRLVQAVSRSPYWRNTAIFVIEDDAQDGPDHVDAHRSSLLVISAWNRKGQLVHDVHNTISAVRTIELLLGIAPMNQLDAAAIPMDIFESAPDLTPYSAQLPVVADDNLIFTKARNARERRYVEEMAQQHLSAPDMADTRLLNEIIWYSVRGDAPQPPVSRWAAADALQAGLDDEGREAAEQPLAVARLALERALARAVGHGKQ